MKIENMTLDMIDEICNIENICFSHPWSKNSLISEFEEETSKFYVCIEEDVIIGYICFSVIVDEGYILNIATLPEYRNKGAASMLMNKVITDSKKNDLSFISLEVRESNSNAISLYNKFGFIKVFVRKNYYSVPTENAILMTRYF